MIHHDSFGMQTTWYQLFYQNGGWVGKNNNNNKKKKKEKRHKIKFYDLLKKLQNNPRQ